MTGYERGILKKLKEVSVSLHITFNNNQKVDHLEEAMFKQKQDQDTVCLSETHKQQSSADTSTQIQNA